VILCGWEGKRQAWWKVMAAIARLIAPVTCRLIVQVRYQREITESSSSNASRIAVFGRCRGMSSTVRLSYLLIHLHSFACQLCVRQSPGVVSAQAACPTRQRRLGGLVRPRPKLSTVWSTLFTSRSFCTLQRSFVLNATVKPIFVNFTTLCGAILHDPITTFSLYKKSSKVK